MASDRNMNIDQHIARQSAKFIDEREKRERRLILIGKSGHGKSSTGNSICGSKAFSVSPNTSSHTKHCRPASRTLDEIDLLVLDTPGLFDTETDFSVITAEIGRAVNMASPGPHAFLIHFKIGNRFTDEEQRTVEQIQEIFGEDAGKFCILVLSGEDDLLYNDQTVEHYLENAALGLKRLFVQCQNRCVAFNNRAAKAEIDDKVRQLLKIIEKMLTDNQTRYYTNEQFKRAEQVLQEREQATLAAKLIEIEKQKQSLREEIYRELEAREKATEDHRRELEQLAKELRQQHREESAQSKPSLIESFCAALPAVAQATAQIATIYKQTSKKSSNDKDEDMYSNKYGLGESLIGHSFENKEDDPSIFTQSKSNAFRFFDRDDDHFSAGNTSDSDSD